jgi:hypothetical protein
MSGLNPAYEVLQRSGQYQLGRMRQLIERVSYNMLTFCSRVLVARAGAMPHDLEVVVARRDRAVYDVAVDLYGNTDSCAR